MKNLKLALYIMMLSFGLLLTGCSKDKDNNNQHDYWNYSLDQFGNCIDNRTRQMVERHRCNNRNGQQQYGYDQNGFCVDLRTRQPVRQDQQWLCQQQGGIGGQYPGYPQPGIPNQPGYPNQGGYEVCVGQYYSHWGPVWCQQGFFGSSSSCSGQQLTNQWGQTVFCR